MGTWPQPIRILVSFRALSTYGAHDFGAGTIVGGRYRLLHVAGRGGMAVVWRGEVLGARGFTRPVAIKQMHAHLFDKPLYVQMFCEEARVGAALEHPNIARIFDFVEQDGELFLICEWIEGIDLASYIHFVFSRGLRTRWDLVSAIGIGMLYALAAAHERVTPDGHAAPVVHRDVSPHNILLDERGVVKLIDFGLCLAWDRRQHLTEPGVVKGKMAYLSPEVVGGQRPSPLSDQFAVGSILWEALVGRKLFDGPTDFDVYCKLRDCRIEPLRPCRPDLPSKLISIINRALSSDESKRFSNVRDMARELAMVLKHTKAPKDLHTLLARSVSQARSYGEIVHEVVERSDETPIIEFETPAAGPRDTRAGRLWHRLRTIGRS